MFRRHHIFAAGAMTIALAFSFAVPAHAETTNAGVLPAAVANCIHHSTGNHIAYKYVNVTNHCSHYVSVKAIIRWAADGRCMGIRPGQKKVDRYGPQGTFERLVYC